MAYHYRKKIEARKRKVRRIKMILAVDGILILVLVLVLIGMGIRKWSRSDGAAPASASTSEDSENQDGTEDSEAAKAEQEPDSVTITVSAAGDCTLGTDESFDYESGFTGIYDSVGDPSYFLKKYSLFSVRMI